MKTCSKCGETKPLDKYSRDKHRRDGRTPRCKACVKAYAAGWYAKNRERILEHQDKNRDRRLAQQAEYRARPEVKARMAEYKAEYNQAKPHIRWEAGYRQRARAYGFEPRVVSFTREALVAKYGDACVYCGGPFEELDHHIPVAHGGPHTIENARPSCVNCNRPGRAVRTTNNTQEVSA